MSLDEIMDRLITECQYGLRIYATPANSNGNPPVYILSLMNNDTPVHCGHGPTEPAAMLDLVQTIHGWTKQEEASLEAIAARSAVVFPEHLTAHTVLARLMELHGAGAEVVRTTLGWSIGYFDQEKGIWWRRETPTLAAAIEAYQTSQRTRIASQSPAYNRTMRALRILETYAWERA